MPPAATVRTWIIIALWLFLTVGVVGGCLFIASKVDDISDGCMMEEPLDCISPLGGSDGALVTFRNVGEKHIIVTDVTASRGGEERCYFPRLMGREWIDPGEIITYFITLDHPDGKCLLEDLKVGKSYWVVFEVEYLLEGETYFSRGNGIMPVSDEKVYDKAVN